ncbi:RLP7 [Candida oxycetoniae]|uniref:RLP7 n=1 Tax=Candida oxycetoniae TaxID=497107 RepID=A0AAI9SXP9_9ASCO|nr:RLP7 [Candida oxycetoniae]KAI3405026.2 RLP7 [Candida oxycetoniae]
MAILNSNPEILLRKRKNADRKRLEKQEQIREKIAASKRLKLIQKKNKFIRAETLLSNHKSNEIERKRLKNVSKKLNKLNNEKNNQLGSKSEGQEEYRLLLLIRIPNHTKGLKIPKKAYQILQVLKLTESNTGVFVKASESTIRLLGLIAPFVIIGQPSIASIRKLFQKRARIKVSEVNEETNETVEKIVKLDNNQLVEDKFEDDGMICIEDLIHEIISMGDNFIKITSWLEPFKLSQPINGWGPQAKLARLVYNNDHKVSISLAQDYKLQEVEDIDKVIDSQN